MNAPPQAEFAQFRFVRDGAGEPVALPSPMPGERIRLALDCERWRLARLRVFEGAATSAEVLAAFEEEMPRAAALSHGFVSSPRDWGRDGDDLFYADAMRDAEPLPDYLGRVGAIPLSAAAAWTVALADFVASLEAPPATVADFSTLNFEVANGSDGVPGLFLSEFEGWTRPGPKVREHRPEWRLAQIFCSLAGGVPLRTFEAESLPRSLDGLPEGTRGLLLEILAEENEDRFHALREALHELALSADEVGGAPAARMPLQEWLRREWEAFGEGEEAAWPDRIEPGDEPYALVSRSRGAEVHLQFMPGPDNLPREGWLPQHHDATRRPGRRMPQQLQVRLLEDLACLTLIGEERVEGVSLGDLLASAGPLPLDEARAALRRIHEHLSILEGRTGSAPVWWLPPENVIVLAGTRSPKEAAARRETMGPSFWTEFPLKLRLHQTLPGLLAGVDLPPSLRPLARLPRRSSEAARRSAVVLPLVWRLLTGSNFRWRATVEHSLLPPRLADRMESLRVELLEAPESVEETLFELLASLAPEPASSSPDLETEAETESEAEEPPIKAPEQETPEAEAACPSPLPLEIRLNELLEPPVAPTAPPDPLAKPLSEPPREADVEPGVEAPPSSFAPPTGKGIGWLGTTVAALVAAAAFGFWASGWSMRQGPYAEERAPSFRLPEWSADPSDPGERAESELAELLLAEGSAESLRLLPLLAHLDGTIVRREIEPWLRVLANRGDAAASRTMGLLWLHLGEGTERAFAWFLEGARRGDAECRYRCAALCWRPGAEPAPGEEVGAFLMQAAEGGHPGAEALLARLRAEEGDGEAAFYWMGRAAGQDWLPALHALGVLHAGGIGTPASPAEAAARFRAAAERGETAAMHDYARCLASGFGVAVSYPEALRWMRLAAAAGHEASLEWLRERPVDPPAP